MHIYSVSGFSEISLLADFHFNNRETEQLSIIEQSSTLQLSTLLQWTLRNQRVTPSSHPYMHASIHISIHPSILEGLRPPIHDKST